MKLSMNNPTVGGLCFEVMDKNVATMLMGQYVVYKPYLLDDDAPTNTPRLDVMVQINGSTVPAVSMFDLLYLERNAYAERMHISYTKRRIVKKIQLIALQDSESVDELKELSISPSFRISLSARCILWPELDVHYINDNYFIRIIGNYWAVVGNQTVWDTSDEITF